MDASVALKRAIDLSRNLDGLFNIEQLRDPRPADRVLCRTRPDHGSGERAAVRVARGRERLTANRTPACSSRSTATAGGWRIGRYTTARLLYARALTIAEKSGGRGTVSRRAAAGHRAQLSAGIRERPRRTGSGAGSLRPRNGLSADLEGQRLNPDGERALRLALNAIDKRPRRSQEARRNAHGARRLVCQRGRLHQGRGGVPRSVERAERGECARRCSTARACWPIARRLVHARSRLDADESEEHFVEVSYTVTRKGARTTSRP